MSARNASIFKPKSRQNYKWSDVRWAIRVFASTTASKWSSTRWASTAFELSQQIHYSSICKGYLNGFQSLGQNRLCAGLSNGSSSQSTCDCFHKEGRRTNANRRLSIRVLACAASLNEGSKSVAHSSNEITSLQSICWFKENRRVSDNLCVHHDHIRTIVSQEFLSMSTSCSWNRLPDAHRCARRTSQKEKQSEHHSKQES